MITSKLGKPVFEDDAQPFCAYINPSNGDHASWLIVQNATREAALSSHITAHDLAVEQTMAILHELDDLLISEVDKKEKTNKIGGVNLLAPMAQQESLDNSVDTFLLQELVLFLRNETTRLEKVLAKTPNLAVADILNAQPKTHAASVREVIFGIYNRTAKILGRNSPEAVKADARVWVRGLESAFSTYKGNPEAWISKEIYPFADADIQEQLSAAEVYRHTDSSVFKRFYQALANLRRATPNKSRIRSTCLQMPVTVSARRLQRKAS